MAIPFVSLIFKLANNVFITHNVLMDHFAQELQLQVQHQQHFNAWQYFQ